MQHLRNIFRVVFKPNPVVFTAWRADLPIIPEVEPPVVDMGKLRWADPGAELIRAV